MKNSEEPFDVDDNDDLTKALRHYLLFSYWPFLLEGKIADFDDSIIFYNSYYWFKKYSKLYMARYGYDVGLEQQAFQALENVNLEIDWEIIEQIENLIEEEEIS